MGNISGKYSKNNKEFQLQPLLLPIICTAVIVIIIVIIKYVRLYVVHIMHSWLIILTPKLAVFVSEYP